MTDPITSTIVIRPADPEDLPACVDIYRESLADMNMRLNLPPSAPAPQAAMLANYGHIRTTGIFHVSQVDGEIAGLACAIVRGDVWFLAGFWVRPGLQGRHIGMPLLRKVWQAGQDAGARTYFVWSSLDLPAMAAYLKLGMLPGTQILTIEGTPNALPELPPGYSLTDLEPSFATHLDKQLLGMPRPQDHAFWSSSGVHGVSLVHDDRPVGYFYQNHGMVGPLGWLDPVHAWPLLTCACRLALESSPIVRLRIPGMNHTALRFALEAGLPLIGYSHLLLSAPFGKLENYMPSGPGLF